MFFFFRECDIEVLSDGWIDVLMNDASDVDNVRRSIRKSIRPDTEEGDGEVWTSEKKREKNSTYKSYDQFLEIVGKNCQISKKFSNRAIRYRMKFFKIL